MARGQPIPGKRGWGGGLRDKVPPKRPRGGRTGRRGRKAMAYDLLIKDGRVVDGSGMPSFRADVGIKDGKIAEIGKLSGPAAKTIDADGRAVSPGFIDNHCHYDAQVTWDPLCTFSPEHGATSVIFGNCSLSLAPVRKGTQERLAEFLSYVEAIPMEVLKTVEFEWETIPQYMDRLDQHLGINVVYNSLSQTMRRPDEWKIHMARIEETASMGIRAYPMCSPNRVTQDFTMKNTQVFRGLPTWHPILLMPDAEKLRLYADPEIRAKLHEEAVVNKPDSAVGISKSWWNYIWVNEPALETNKWMQFKSIGQIAETEGKRVIDAFLDLVVEEKLETRFLQAENNIDDEALSKILTHPNAVIGLGDGGAHVQFHGGYGYITKLLGEWVSEKQGMSLEQAVRRFDFDST